MTREPSEARLVELRAMPYAQYLLTPEWRHRRDRALARASWHCEWPQCDAQKSLEVHHKTYERIGEELPMDLAVLCVKHHQGLHDKQGSAQRIHWRIIRDVLNAGEYSSIADLVEDIKRRHHANGVVYDPHAISDVIGQALREVTIPLSPPKRQDEVLVPAITHRESVKILADLGIQSKVIRTIRPVPHVESDEAFEAARLRALEMGIELERKPAIPDIAKATSMVMAEIEASVARCKALEAGLSKKTDA